MNIDPAVAAGPERVEAEAAYDWHMDRLPTHRERVMADLDITEDDLRED